MKRLIILGNGFDLAHGLKTSYLDFMLDLFKTEISLFFDNRYIDHFAKKSTHQNGPINIIQQGNLFISEEERASVLQIKTIEELRIFINKYKISILPVNSPSILGYTQTHLEAFNWADVEAIYYDILLGLVEKDSSRKLSAGIKGQITRLNQELDFFKDRLIKYLSRVQENSNISGFLDGEHFWNIFLGQRFDSLSPQEVQILNFNYTNTVVRYGLPKGGFIKRNVEVQINNIHGQLNDPDSIIFGYGDEVDSFYKRMEDLNDNEVLRHAKSFGYFKNGSYQKLLRFLESGEYEVWVVGHSCGLSDRVMLQKVFEHPLCRKIRIYHYCTGETNDHTEKTQQISRHFSNKELMRERIVPFNSNDEISNLVRLQKKVLT